MSLSRELIAVLFVLWVTFALSAAAKIPWEGDLSFKATVKQDAIDLDTTIDVSYIREPFVLTSTWKATEKGFASLKVIGKTELGEGIESRVELLFGKESLESLKLKKSDLPFAEALLDVETTFKGKNGLELYQVDFDIDDLSLAKLPASLEFVFREAYLRAKLTLDREDETIGFQGIWKKGTFSEGKVTWEHETEDWSVKEVATFKPSALRLRPEKGTLTVEKDLLDNLTLKAVCDHSFPDGGIEVTKLTLTLELKVGAFDLTWKGTFLPVGTVFCLGGYTLTLADKVEINDLSLSTVLKINEDGFDSLSLRLSLDG